MKGFRLRTREQGWSFEDPLAERCANAPMAWIDEQLDAANIDYDAVHDHITALLLRHAATQSSRRKMLLRIAACMLLALFLSSSNETRRTPAMAVPPQTSPSSSSIPTASLPITPSVPTRNEATAAVTNFGTGLQNAPSNAFKGTAGTVAHSQTTDDLRRTASAHAASTVNVTATTRGQTVAWLGGLEDRRSLTSRAWQYDAQTTQPQETASLGVEPAATLLLPYFEVDTAGAQGTGSTTLWTITNTSHLPQIAQVTVWTDWSFPVLDFNIFLTGYDVQAINMFDVLNIHSTDGVSCPDPIGSNTGTIAKGYVTIDVTPSCLTQLPTDPASILFDNVLIGDYRQVSSTNNFAQGKPLVHIRAIPGSGVAGSRSGTNLAHTFYGCSRDAINPRRDRRQPLPATFAARWIDGGTGTFESSFKIWREGFSFGAENGAIPIAFGIRFDEHESSFDFGGWTNCSPCGPGQCPELPETSPTPINANPPFPCQGTDMAGWVYVNLDNGGLDDYLALGVRASQNVIVSPHPQGRFSVDFDAAWLGDSCTTPQAQISPAAPAGAGELICGPTQPPVQNP